MNSFAYSSNSDSFYEDFEDMELANILNLANRVDSTLQIHNSFQFNDDIAYGFETHKESHNFLESSNSTSTIDNHLPIRYLFKDSLIDDHEIIADKFVDIFND